jgi:predicted CXXCH cytochrome family protein
MESYHIPTDQFDKYSQSVHGIALLKHGDVSAPACNSCHGNHGAAPPGLSTVANVCGSCHAFNADLFNKSAHKAVFDKQNLPECVECHSNHLVRPPSDTLVGVGPGTVCGRCHNNPNDSAAKVIMTIRGTLDSLNLGKKHAEEMLAYAEQIGMDVGDAAYTLKDINQSLVQSRVQMHSLTLAPVAEAAEPGLKIVARAQQSALEAVKDFYFRRQGLGIATLIISALAIALYLKIRSIERK